jgi:hypothetical protein
MAARKRKRRLGGVKHDSTRVSTAARNVWTRKGWASKDVPIKARVHRTTSGSYGATVCVGHRGPLPRKGRCASGVGASPTVAVRLALLDLARELR